MLRVQNGEEEWLQSTLSTNQSRILSPVRFLGMLKVEEQRRHNLVHVLRVPDVRLQFIVHSLPYHALESFDARHADSGRGKSSFEHGIRNCTRFHAT